MNAIEKLDEWFSDQRENHGLLNFHMTLNPDFFGTDEEIAEAVLAMINAPRQECVDFIDSDVPKINVVDWVAGL